jgi:hypothetical protein
MAAQANPDRRRVVRAAAEAWKDLVANHLKELDQVAGRGTACAEGVLRSLAPRRI